jgi:hypothetical protein
VGTLASRKKRRVTGLKEEKMAPASRWKKRGISAVRKKRKRRQEQ